MDADHQFATSDGRKPDLIGGMALQPMAGCPLSSQVCDAQITIEQEHRQSKIGPRSSKGSCAGRSRSGMLPNVASKYPGGQPVFTSFDTISAM